VDIVNIVERRQVKTELKFRYFLLSRRILSYSGDAVTGEGKSVTKKCSIRFSNIKVFDCGPASETSKKTTSRKQGKTSPLKIDLPP
jgi:hypothetical protein